MKSQFIFPFLPGFPVVPGHTFLFFKNTILTLFLKSHSFAIWSQHVEIKYISPSTGAGSSLARGGLPVVAEDVPVSIPGGRLVSQQPPSSGRGNWTGGIAGGKGGGVWIRLVQEKGQQLFSSDVSSFLLGPRHNLLRPFSLPVPRARLRRLSTHL